MDYRLTTGKVASLCEGDATVPLVVRYCDLGLLPYQRASDGTRLLKEDAPALVRQIKAQRLANRGRRREPDGRAA